MNSYLCSQREQRQELLSLTLDNRDNLGHFMKYYAKYVVINEEKKLIIYDREFCRSECKKSFNNSSNKRIRKNESKKISRESMQRTRNNLKNLILCNLDKFNSFVTLTYSNNQEDLDRAYKDIHKFFRRWRIASKKNNEELYYIAVYEFQKRGAIHFHILTSLEIDTPLLPKREAKRVRSKGKCLTLDVYDIPDWEHGYSTAIALDKSIPTRVVNYLGKYLTKDISHHLAGKRKILQSKNLRRPFETLLNNAEDIESIKSDIQSEHYEKAFCDNGYFTYEIYTSKQPPILAP